MNYQSYIHRDPSICAGEPVIKGTLSSLAEGASIEQVREAFPSVSEDAVRAVIAFAALSAVDDLPPPASKAA
jgi:uncharacterized protein (DUF433 family)